MDNRGARLAGRPSEPRAATSGAISARIRPGASGSAKSTVPSATALAPTAASSTASRAGEDTAHAHDRDVDRLRARMDAGERDRSEAGPEYPPTPRREPWPKRDRVERETRGSCSRATARRHPPRPPHAPTRRCPIAPARASRRASWTSRRAPRRRARPPSRAPPRRSGTTGSARSRRSGRPRRGARSRARSRPRRSRRPRPRAAPRAREPREALPGECVDAGPLQADRVQHPVLGLRDPDGRVAGARERRDRLRHDDVERARDVGCRQRVEAPGGVEERDRHAAPARRTGPSMQRRT